MHDTELYDSRYVILSLSSLSSLLSLYTRSTSNIIYLYIRIYDCCSSHTQVFRIFFVSQIVNSIFLNKLTTLVAVFYFKNIYSSINYGLS
jgi:hypothetical protein